MLDRKMKTFIKTICCHPHQMTDSLRQSVMIDFKSSEKVYISINYHIQFNLPYINK